jgi:hypothetical protein
MLEILFRPLRSALGVAEHEATAPLAEPERELVDAVQAIHRAADSIDHHVQVIEGLATSVGPLTDSVDRLTATMADLTAILAPLGKAEHEVGQIERRFGFRRRQGPTERTAEQVEADAGAVTPPSDERAKPS